MKIKVHTTKNYDQFKFVFGNREINQANLQRIKNSVEENDPLVSILIVNDKMEIIDGQHRFLIWKELDLPINYVIKNGYGLPQVHTFNQNTKNWGMNEFMESYVSMGYKNYQTYKFFKQKYKFGHNETLTLLMGGASNRNASKFDLFRKGKFKVKNYTAAVDMAEKIYEFEPYYEGFKRKAFVFAVAKLVNSNGNYSHNTMINKLTYQSAKLTDQPKTSDYLKVLEKIYNYRSRSDYVRFDLLN